MNFKKMVKDYEKTSLATLKGFINIDSVYDAKSVTKTNPYGAGVSKALKYIQDLALADGLQVRNIDNRVVEIYFGDPRKPNIGVFAHADVVPATGDWESPPFAATERNGYLFGRGTSDDKGPAIASYYALLALLRNNLVNDYSVRLVIGGDEERGSSCMKHYFEDTKAPAPMYGFTPDAQFPLIYGEKGITNFKATKRGSFAPITALSGGEAANSVIDKIVATLPEDEELLAYLQAQNVSFSVEKDNGVIRLTLHGKSAHGSLPHLGVNAGVLLFKHLGAFYHIEHFQRLAKLFLNPNGTTLDGYLSSPLLGESTYNLGLLSLSGDELSLVVNFRYPENVNLDDHLKKVSQTLDMDINVLSTSPHLLFDPESEFILTLLQAYQDETGDLGSKPLAIGGGTYAKNCPNTVAFGSAFVGRDGDIHSPNEHVLLSDFYAQMAIYARAINCLGTKLCA